MTKIISDILEAREPLFSVGIEQIERLSGRPNVDIRLTADILSMVYRKKRELGLDPRDTTDHELYQALHNLVRLHDNFLAHHIGGRDPSDVADMLPRIIHTVNNLNIPRSAWLMKNSAAKKLLKTMPPKKLMKLLGYRSLDSMLKRESIGALYVGMRFVESEQWLANFMATYSKLTPSDFEVRDVEIVSLNSERWKPLLAALVKQKHHNVVEVKELGTIAVLPLPLDRLAGLTITLLPMLLRATNETRLYSAYFKLHQVRPEFGKRLANSVTADTEPHTEVAGHRIHWRVVQRHYGKQTPKYHPETFEPHLQAEDLAWRGVEETLCRLEPALQFWQGLDFVALPASDGRPLSFNLIDVALNYVNQLPFEKRVYAHAVNALSNELYGRYLERPAVENQVLKQFDHLMCDSEPSLLRLRKSNGVQQ